MFRDLLRKLPFVPSLLALCLLLIFTQIAFAATLTGTMQINREVKAGAAECYRTVGNVSAGDSVKLLGRNADATWVFIWSDAVDGWVPASSVNVTGDVTILPVWTDHFNGATCTEQFDSRICGRPGNTTAASTTRWTDIYDTADPDSTFGRAYPPNSSVTILGRDFWGCWVSVQGSGDAGWVPVNALNERGVLGLPILIDNSNGCSIDDGVVACPDDD